MTNESHKEQTHSENSTYDVCPDCMYPVEPEWDTCPWCNAPGHMASPKTIAGFTRELNDFVPEGTELLYLWIELGLWLVIGLVLAVMAILPNGLSAFYLLIGIPLAAVAGYVLFRMTYNYFKYL